MNTTTCTPTFRTFARSAHPLAGFTTPMERAFEEFWSSRGWPARSGAVGAFPPVNAWETEHAMIIEAELPGFSEKDIDVSATGNELTIAGSREIKHPDGAVLHRTERASGRFSRMLRLAPGFDLAKVTASFERGVLTITVPKSEESKPRKVEVKTV